jgi:chromosome segregation and condensation protein ScpB
MRREWDPEDLIACWTLIDSDWALVGNKTAATRLGFVALLKFFELEARFPRHRAEVPKAAVDDLADQVKVDPSLFGEYDVRLALRRLAGRLESAGMQVLDDGRQVQLGPERRFHEAVAHLVPPEQLPRLTQEQAEVLAIVISDGMTTRRRIEEVRGAAQLSIGPGGALSLPRDSSETLALLLSRGLLCADRDDHATGRPLVYRPTPRLLQLLGAETLEEARGRLGVPADYGFATKSIPGAGPFGHEAPADGAAE